MRVLVTEKIADGGLQRLRDAGHEVDIRTGLSAEELLEVVPGAHALIIRSATKVTKEVLAAGSDLVVVGRAGIGLDNVDTEAATEQGVMVVNAPQSNTLSAAEHTMALLLAQARNVPQAHAALQGGSLGALAVDASAVTCTARPWASSGWAGSASWSHNGRWPSG